MPAQPFIGQISIFCGNFPPKGWATCDGQLLAIQTNTALFSLIGTYYGGDGRVTFGLPDLRGRAAMLFGQGPGLTPRVIGELSGNETVTLLSTQFPPHTHSLPSSSEIGEATSPAGNTFARNNIKPYINSPANATVSIATNLQGGNLPHNNMQPYLTLTFIIALQGIFPPRP
jgi:microcystin-dependent protein